MRGAARRADVPARARRGRGRGGRAARAEGQGRARPRVPADLGRTSARGRRAPAATARWSAASERARGCSPRSSTSVALERPCRLVTLVGEAGRRQVAPASRSSLRCVADGARRAARPLPPLRARHHVLAAASRSSAQAAAIRDDDAPRTALREARCSSPAPSSDDAVERVASAIGLSRAAAFPLEEIFWGDAEAARDARRARRPLVVVFDDIHWAEPTLPRPDRAPRSTRSRTRRSCSLCAARPELLEQRPDWAERDGRRASRSSRSPTSESERVVENAARRRGVAAEVRRADRRRGRGQPALRRADALDARRRRAPPAARTAAGSRRGDLAELAVPPTIQRAPRCAARPARARGARRRRAGVGDRAASSRRTRSQELVARRDPRRAWTSHLVVADAEAARPPELADERRATTTASTTS